MRVVPTDVALLEDLARFLERFGCDVERAADSLEVSVPFVPDWASERILRVFLANWRSGDVSIE